MIISIAACVWMTYIRSLHMFALWRNIENSFKFARWFKPKKKTHLMVKFANTLIGKLNHKLNSRFECILIGLSLLLLLANGETCKLNWEAIQLALNQWSHLCHWICRQRAYFRFASNLISLHWFWLLQMSRLSSRSSRQWGLMHEIASSKLMAPPGEQSEIYQPIIQQKIELNERKSGHKNTRIQSQK